MFSRWALFRWFKPWSAWFALFLASSTLRLPFKSCFAVLIADNAASTSLCDAFDPVVGSVINCASLMAWS